MKAFIFDLDGVLVSTDELHYEAWKKIADAEGIYFDRTINDRLRGISREDSLEIILEKAAKKYSGEEKAALAEKKNVIYKELLNGLTSENCLDGAEEILDYLKKAGYKLAVGSSSKNAAAILKRTGLESRLDAVSDGNNIKRGKPDPEVFLKAAAMLGMPPGECYIVEDSVTGIFAGKKGGFVTIGIASASSCKDADFRITTLKDIRKIISQSR